MLRCILLDDEWPSLTYLRRLCEQSGEVEIVRAFNDPKKLLAELPALDYEVCILDIEMPGISGLEIAKQLRGKAIIFSTAYREYAADAYDLDAVDYLRKPITALRLEKALQKAQAYLDNQKVPVGSLQWNSNKGKVILNFDDILGITVGETDKRDKQVFLKSGTSVLLKNISFEQLIKLLPEKDFLRINRQTVLAKQAVAAYTHDTVTTHIAVGGEDRELSFPLNEHYRKEFLERITV